MQSEKEFNKLCYKIDLLVTKAEKQIGKLTFGQTSDLILDNFEEVKDSDHAHSIIRTMQMCGYDIGGAK